MAEVLSMFFFRRELKFSFEHIALPPQDGFLFSASLLLAVQPTLYLVFIAAVSCKSKSQQQLFSKNSRTNYTMFCFSILCCVFPATFASYTQAVHVFGSDVIFTSSAGSCTLHTGWKQHKDLYEIWPEMAWFSKMSLWEFLAPPRG